MGSFRFLQGRLDRINKCGLSFIFFIERSHNLFVNRTGGYDVVNDYGFCLLSLSPQSGVGLLIQFQAPREPEPDQRGTTGLKVQAVSGRSGMNYRHRNIARVPVNNVLGSFYFPDGETLLNPLKVMFEPVRHEDRLAVGGFDADGVYTIPMGFHDGSGTVALDATEKEKLVAGNIKSGVEILGVTGTYSGEAITAQSKTVTPATVAQTIQPDSGYDYLSGVTVNAIPYVESDNAAGGKTATIG